MLNVVDSASARMGRRSFLQIGTLGMAGLSLADLLACRAAAAAQGVSAQDKAVVLLFLQGGPPQHETFDPKMSASENIRSTTGEVQTRLSGITFGGTFPRMANLADRLAVVRSFQSRNGGHEYVSTTSGGFPGSASMSAIYTRLAGTMHPTKGMPRNVVVVPEIAKEGLRLGGAGGTGSLNGLITPGNLGSAYEAFNPAGGAAAGLRKLVELAIPRERFEDRRALLQNLDALRRDIGSQANLDRYHRHQQQAFEVILNGIMKAFDLSREDPRVVARYDTSHIYKMEDWWKYANFKRSTNLLGKQMLLARRLVEHGCGFVTVSDCGWDFHADPSSPPAMTGMIPLGRQVDHAVSAFLEDVRQRGLEDRILLIVTGEMGRTPRLNAQGGRDHWGDLTPLVFAGGGLRMGQVIGQADRDGARPVAEPYTPANLVATVMHYLFDVLEMRLRSDLPESVTHVLDVGVPIRRLFEG